MDTDFDLPKFKKAGMITRLDVVATENAIMKEEENSMVAMKQDPTMPVVTGEEVPVQDAIEQDLNKCEGYMYCKVDITSGGDNLFGFAFRSILSRSIHKFEVTSEIVKDVSAEFEYYDYSIQVISDEQNQQLVIKINAESCVESSGIFCNIREVLKLAPKN